MPGLPGEIQTAASFQPVLDEIQAGIQEQSKLKMPDNAKLTQFETRLNTLITEVNTAITQFNALLEVAEFATDVNAMRITNSELDKLYDIRSAYRRLIAQMNGIRQR